MERPSQDPVAELGERIARLEPSLDDVARQRVLAGIHARMNTDVPARSAGARARIAMALAASVAAAMLALWWPRTTATSRVAHRSAPVRDAVVPAPATAPALVPYAVSGCDALRAEQLLDRPATRIELASGERLLAALGDRARIALDGPARLELRATSAARVELELLQGSLFGDYDYRRGGELAIHAPGVRTEVVGTLFSVLADRATTRVAVARGAVRAYTGSAAIPIAGGESWSPQTGAPKPISTVEAEALNAVARSLAPPSGVHGLLGLTGARSRVEVAGQVLGQMPVWALMPAGAITVMLRDVRDQPHELHTTVRANERTEVQVANAPSTSARSGRGDRRASSNSPARASAPAASAQDRAAAAQAPRNAEELYSEAEAAMRDADRARAAQLLTELVRRHADAAIVDLALYDLAQMAFRENDYASAERWLERLTAHGTRAALREPAQHLRCRLVQAKEPSATPEQCFTGSR